MSDFKKMKIHKEKQTKRHLVICAMLTTFFMLMMASTSCIGETILHKLMIGLTGLCLICTVAIFTRIRNLETEIELIACENSSSLEIARYERKLHSTIQEVEVFPIILRRLVISGFNENDQEVNIEIPNTKEIRNFFMKNGITIS